MKHSIHIKLCALFVVSTYVLLAAGAGVSALVPVLVCAVIVGASFWMLERRGRLGRR
jgi:hypothetical protein